MAALNNTLKNITDLYVYSVWFLIIKPTRCINFSNLFLEWNSTCFGQFLRPSSVFHCTHSNGISHTGLLTACSQAVSKPVWLIPLLCVQWKTPDDGRRNCPKHVEFHSKNKFEKLMHLVGFIIRNLTRCMVTWTSNSVWCWNIYISSTWRILCGIWPFHLIISVTGGRGMDEVDEAVVSMRTIIYLTDGRSATLLK